MNAHYLVHKLNLNILLSMTSLADIGKLIRQTRKAQGLSGLALAERAGISRNTLGALEAGRGNVELNTLISLLDSLGLEMQFVPLQVADLTRVGADTRTTGLQDEVSRLMPAARQ
jgi:transcriptional regulator with XRE-family HTH domain